MMILNANGQQHAATTMFLDISYSTSIRQTKDRYTYKQTSM